MPSFSQFLLDNNEQQRLAFRLRCKWMIRVRWYYVVSLPLVAIIAILVAHDSTYYIRIYLMVMGIGLVLNGVLWLTTLRKSGSERYYWIVAILQVVLDLSLASAAVYAGGGADSRAVALYAMPVVVSGVLFRHPGAYLAAGLSGLAYLGVIVSYPLVHHSTTNFRLILSPGIFFPIFFLILAAIITRFGAVNAMDEREHTYQQLLSMLRHQLHNPSSVIAAIAEMLERSDDYAKWSDKNKEYIRQLKRENLRLNTMITNVLEAVSDKTEAPLAHPKKINLLEMLNDTAISCALAARRLSDLDTKLPHEHIEMDAQPHQLRTALDNIVENAFHYSQAGTPVTVSLSYDEPSGIVTIEVTDKGPGMTADQQKDLFKLFTRLEEQAGEVGDEAKKLYSMGLGLYVSKVIIERHHGTMKIESKHGKGTSVIIKFQEKLWLRPEFYT